MIKPITWTIQPHRHKSKQVAITTPFLNDPLELEEGINYTIMQALLSQIEALKNIVVLVHPT